jgi:4-amino-4-deoxy-L-arabinose transferase-like glycosyltransferase
MSPHGYYVYGREKGAVYSLFPPGVSFFLYPFVKAFGRGAAFFIMPLLNLALLSLFFVLGTKAVDAVFGLCFSAFTFFNFHVFENSAVIMSDLPSMGLLAAAAYLLWRNGRNPRRFLTAFAGACFGLSLVFRYSNLVGLLPLAWIAWVGWRGRRRLAVLWREIAAFSAAAAALGVLPLAVYTYRLFGTPFRLVYEPISQSRFQAANLGLGLSYYLQSLWRTFGPVPLAIAVFGLAALLLQPKRRSVAAACLLAFFAFFGFHVFHSIQNERYLLPAYPFLGLLFAFGVRETARLTRRSFAATLLVVALCGSIPFARSRPTFRQAENQAEQWAASLAGKIEPGGVVFCDELSGSLRIYQGIPGYRFVPTDGATLLQAADILTSRGRPVYLYVDNALAEEPFRLLLERTPSLARRLEPAAVVRGRVLFKYSPRKQARLTAAEGAGRAP